MGSGTPSPPGNFSYPPPGSSLLFNYIDSLVTSWLTFDPSATHCRLSIWYWPNINPWVIGMSKPRFVLIGRLLESDLKLPTHDGDNQLLTGYPHHL